MVRLGRMTFPSPVNPPAEGCRYPTPVRGEPPTPGAVATWGRAVPGVSPGTGFCRWERMGSRVCRNRWERAGARVLGCRGRLRAELASPRLTGWDCQRRCHPAPGQDSTQGPWGWRGHPNPALVPEVQLRRGTRCPGASFPPPSLQPLAAHRDGPRMRPPTCPQPSGRVTACPELGSWGESWRRAGERGALGSKALPCPFLREFPCWRKRSIISLAHQRQLPMGALHLHIYTDANITPRKFSAFTSRAKTCRGGLTFFSLSMASGEPVPGQTLPWDTPARILATGDAPLQQWAHCDGLGLQGHMAHLRVPRRPGLPHRCPGLQHHVTQEEEGTPGCPPWGAGIPPHPLHPFVRQENKDQEQLPPPWMQRAHRDLKILMPPAPPYRAQCLSESRGWRHRIGTCQGGGVPLCRRPPSLVQVPPIPPQCLLCLPPLAASSLAPPAPQSHHTSVLGCTAGDNTAPLLRTTPGG